MNYKEPLKKDITIYVREKANPLLVEPLNFGMFMLGDVRVTWNPQYENTLIFIAIFFRKYLYSFQGKARQPWTRKMTVD